MQPEPFPSRADLFRIYPLGKLPKGFASTGEGVAFHEAGHVVVADALGLPVAAAMVSGNQGAMTLLDEQPLTIPAGRTDTAFQAAFLLLAAQVAVPGADKDDLALSVCTILMAGVQAELIHAGQRPEGSLWLDDTDTREACAILHREFGTTTPLGWCQATARAHLAQRWRAVESIAAELITRGVWGKARAGATNPAGAALA